MFPQRELHAMGANLPGERSWRAAEDLRWRCWDGDFVVFNPLSGYTHLLDVVTGQILTLLISGRCTVSAVRSALSAFLEVPDDDKLAETVEGILIRLEDTGLVERLD
jgi:PqqD family protein of HPr-rel-A system